jgi:hypothetical protein
LIAALLAVFLPSCMSSTFDVRGIKQPIVMNRNPVANRNESSPTSGAVDTYAAIVGRSQFTSSSPTGSQNQVRTQQTWTVANDAQVQAFMKIGGDSGASITEVSLEYRDRFINLLLALGMSVDVSAKGTVRRQGVPDSHPPERKP